MRALDYLINIDIDAIDKTNGIISQIVQWSQVALYYSVEDGKQRGSGRQGTPSSLSGFRGSFHSGTRFDLMKKNLHKFRFEIGDLVTGMVINQAGYSIPLTEHEIGLGFVIK